MLLPIQFFGYKLRQCCISIIHLLEGDGSVCGGLSLSFPDLCPPPACLPLQTEIQLSPSITHPPSFTRTFISSSIRSPLQGRQNRRWCPVPTRHTYKNNSVWRAGCNTFPFNNEGEHHVFDLK